jgi:hypothetical protein
MEVLGTAADETFSEFLAAVYKMMWITATA